MAKSRKVKAKSGARRKTPARAHHAAKRGVKARAKAAVIRLRQPVLKAKVAKPLPNKGVLPVKVAG